MSDALTLDDKQTFLARIQRDPVYFCDRILGAKLWGKQQEIAETLVDTQFVYVPSCHASGKSFVAAQIALWFLYSHPNSIVVTTAPTGRQVGKVMWGEIRRAYMGATVPLGGELLQKELKIDPKWYCFGFSTDTATNFSGIHADWVLVICDEATGIAPDIWEGITGVIANANTRLLAICNPTDGSAEIATRVRRGGERTKTIYISAYDTPNFTTFGITESDIAARTWRDKIIGPLPMPYLATPQYAADVYERYGPDSAMYVSRVLGRFPEASADTLIPLSWVLAAIERWKERTELLRQGIATVQGGDKVLGVDIARFGCFDDQTEILTSDGWKLFENLTGREKVLSLNGDTAEWQPITQVYKYDFDGELNLYEGRGSNFCITDNHNLLVRTGPKSEQWTLKRYDECAQEFVVRRGNTWSGHKTPTMTFRSVVPMFHGGARVNEWTFSYIDWARFLGWFVSEGSTYVEKRKHGRGRVQITQMPGFKKETIRMLLTKMGLHFRENGDQFEFSNNTICDHLRRHCGTGASNKRIPRYIKEATPEIIDAFLQAFRLGDGTCKESGKGRTYSTSSQFLADDIQECLVKVGRSGKLTHLKMKGTTTFIQGRSMTRHHDQYVVYERSRGSGSYIKKREVQKVPYKGIVYCVSTPHRTIMVRRNGCPMWSGNSDRTARTYREGAYTHWIRVTQ